MFDQTVPSSLILHVEPLGAVLHLGQLIGATVQSEVFDDPMYRHELYIGEIREAKVTRLGTMVYFVTPDLVGGKWILLNRVRGYAWYEVVETPSPVETIVVGDVIMAEDRRGKEDMGPVIGKTATGKLIVRFADGVYVVALHRVVAVVMPALAVAS